MKIRYSFRTEKKSLPEATTILETTRQLHHEFTQNPAKFWKAYEEWLRPMNCLVPGHFISINKDSKDFKFTKYYNNTCPLRLEYMELGKNYVKVTFEIDEVLPYKVSSGTYELKLIQVIKYVFRYLCTNVKRILYINCQVIIYI